MDGYKAAVSLLPPPLCEDLLRVEPSVQTQVGEIRLRAGQAVTLSVNGTQQSLNIRCTAEQLQAVVQRLLQYSLYSHTEELRRGFITANGCRVGIGGTAILEHGVVTGYRAIDSLCLRVARMHRGCAHSLADILCKDGTVHSALVCGEPSCGKTSLLRDLAMQLAARRWAVSVIDERGEIAIEPLDGCDVLRYTPKSVGIEQAIRCLAPQAILLDELGDGAEMDAVCDGALRSVPTIATAHGRSVSELYRRPSLRCALENGVFDYIAVMHGRNMPGRIASLVRTEDTLHERNRHGVVDTYGGRLGFHGALCAPPPLDSDTTDRDHCAVSFGADSLHGIAHA